MENIQATYIMLVEDDEDLSKITSRQLMRRGYKVRTALDGKSALEIMDSERIDIVLLDVMLPDYDGHELCSLFRSDRYGYHGPIIFMSCLGDSVNIVDAFRNGGNDYVIKPVEISLLTERIQANLKREDDTGPWRRGRQWFKQFMIDRRLYEVYLVDNGKMGEKVELSPTEYKLLDEITQSPNEVMLYRQLYKKVWGQDDLDDYRTLMVHMSNLRKKIDLAHTEVIRAVRGVGYIFQDV
jgi:DNA-binding response OmpR family regulator